VRAWTSEPVDGLVVAGSTGEAPLLDEIEVLRLTEWARSEAPDGVQVVTGTGGESTRGVVRLTRLAAEAGAAAVLVRPPGYYAQAMTGEALDAHYRALADASPVPVILYHIPKYVPVALEPDLVGRLVEHDNIVGIKDSSGDVANLGALLDVCSRRASVMVGAGTLLYGGLEMGASGGVVGVGLLATTACTEIVAAWRDGELERAGALQERVGPLHRAVVSRRGVPGVKAALDLLGLRGGPPRPPLLAADETGRRAVHGALAAAGLQPSHV
jgi:4-hydroxy-2-oxoglutarate aldolase